MHNKKVEDRCFGGPRSSTQSRTSVCHALFPQIIARLGGGFKPDIRRRTSLAQEVQA